MESFHVSAYTASANPATLTQVAAANDTILQIRDSALVVAGVHKLGAAWAVAANLTRLQLQAPSLRKVAQLEVQPLMHAMPGAGGYPSMMERDFMYGVPIELDDGEELAAFVTDSGGVAERINIFVRLHKEMPKSHDGKFFSIRITSSQTLVANAWTNCALTFDQNLPNGKFRVVGARFNSAGAQAFRIFFIGQTYRPGGVAQQSDLAIDPDSQRYGRLGIWGEFVFNAPPSIDVFSTSADTSEEGVLDLEYLG